MHISWLGEGCVKIITKDKKDEKNTLIFDPPDPSSGIKIRGGLNADVVALSKLTPPRGIILPEGPYCLSSPGEYEIKEIIFRGRQAGEYIFWRFEVEGINLGHLGAFKGVLTEQERAFFTDIEVLMLPVGGKEVLSSKEAAELVRNLEPKIVIPLYGKMPGLTSEREPFDKFCKELPCTEEHADKLSLRKNEIPEEGMKMVILMP
jgi:hypothetical protein